MKKIILFHNFKFRRKKIKITYFGDKFIARTNAILINKPFGFFWGHGGHKQAV